tara:strand:+ start:7737 stop:8225 length:489 start_codon:yes stop_codon:yes gene_type:complete
MNPNFDPTQMPLRDIHLPDAVSWWPIAFGWWVLASIVVICSIIFVIRFYICRHRRVACREIQKSIDAINVGQDPVLCAQEVSTIMRRFAMTVNKQPQTVAGLVGEEWLSYLDELWEQKEFINDEGRRLLSAPYKVTGTLDREEFLKMASVCISWIKAQPVRI